MRNGISDDVHGSNDFQIVDLIQFKWSQRQIHNNNNNKKDTSDQPLMYVVCATLLLQKFNRKWIGQNGFSLANNDREAHVISAISQIGSLLAFFFGEKSHRSLFYCCLYPLLAFLCGVENQRETSKTMVIKKSMGKIRQWSNGELK